jgi:hypothetical protein
MLITGEWSLGYDGISRPMIRAEILRSDGGWEPIVLLVDSGADRSTLHGNYLGLLGFEPLESTAQLVGLGGATTDAALVPSRLRFMTTAGQLIPINGPFRVLIDANASDVSILGRDVLDNFSLIIDRPGKSVVLLSGAHRYAILGS